ncbi:MAG: CocE/NonD family hydrolase [Actinobacteria bacterium]|nr:CocE/NonD family hydrolase [Actinomycetota bacterium]
MSSEPTTTSVRVPMRDETVLAGDLYLPPGSGPFPTLLRKTPYARGMRNELDLYLRDQGFAVLVVSQRGKFGSEGVFYQFRNEAVDHHDGYDTIEWAAAQPWSDGQVGTYGVSSDGQWQLSAATLAPPSLKAMVVSYAANPRHALVDHGVLLGTGPAWSSMNGLSRRLGNREDWQDWLESWRRRQTPLLASFIEDEFIDRLYHLDYDSYWEEVDPSNGYDRIQVPILHECGWFDRYVTPTLENYLSIRANAATALARESQWLVMGPWTHGGGVPADTEVVMFGPEATADRPLLHLEWFDKWMRGAPDYARTRVRLYVLGVERWLEADDWPVKTVGQLTLYLAQDDAGAELRGGLVEDAPEVETSSSFHHDPYDPIPSIGGHGGVGWQWPAGPLDQREAEERSLTFTSDPLETSVTVVGRPKLVFHASSTAVDTDFIATLSEVHPNGYSAILRQNGIRAAYRNGPQRAEPLEPGDVYRFELDMDAVGVAFAAGNRIRLRISSTSFPAFLPSPGTTEPTALATKAVEGTNTIYQGGSRASFLSLPVVDPGY